MKDLANIKSAKKRIKITAKKTLHNRIIKSRTHTEMKKVIVAVHDNNKEQAQTALQNALKFIDKAASKGIYHKNNAARKKSRLAKMVNKISA